MDPLVEVAVVAVRVHLAQQALDNKDLVVVVSVTDFQEVQDFLEVLGVPVAAAVQAAAVQMQTDNQHIMKPSEAKEVLEESVPLVALLLIMQVVVVVELKIQPAEVGMVVVVAVVAVL
jgi:hypothetical protein